MCRGVDCVLFVLLINYHCITGTDIKYYEYGARVEGDLVSYFYHGSIPIFTPHYCMTIKPVPESKDHSVSFENIFTYLKVAYFNRVSIVKVEFKAESSLLCFDVHFPFIEMPIGIWGYSLRKI